MDDIKKVIKAIADENFHKMDACMFLFTLTNCIYNGFQVKQFLQYTVLKDMIALLAMPCKKIR